MLIFGTNRLRKVLAFSIHSSHLVDVARTTAVAKAFMKSCFDLQPKASILAIFNDSLSTKEQTFSTNEVLPILLGEINMVFTPYKKFIFRRLVSSFLSVNVFPSTRTPNTKGISFSLAIASTFSAKIYNPPKFNNLV